MSLYPTYPAIIFSDDGQYGILFPDLQGCVATAVSVSDAKGIAGEILYNHLDMLTNHGYPIPEPSHEKSVKLPPHFGHRDYTVLMITANLDYYGERPPHY